MYTQVQQQRPRLALANGKVYASFGGLAGDCGTYNGFVVAANEANGTIAGFFKVAAAPNGSDYFGGAVWGTSGPLIDSSGNVYASTGNGFDNDTLPDPNQTDGVIKLSPTAQLLDWFQSPDWRNDNDSDFDLGSTGPLQLPNNKIFQIGKQGVGFLLDQSNLGGADHHTALASVNVGCGVFGSAVSGTSIFAACKFFSASVGIHQIVVNGNSLSVGWQSPVPANHPPTVDGSVVWAVADGGNTLYGLDAATGAVVAQHPFPLDPSQHFVTPVIMGNLVLVTAGNQVVGYDKTQTSSTQTHTSTTTSTTAASTTTATSAPATTTPATTPSTTSPSASTTSP
jgi:hypothetical protein